MDEIKSKLSPPDASYDTPDKDSKPNLSDLLQDQLNTNQHNRWLRAGYACSSLVLAAVTVIFWGYFILFKYDKNCYSDNFFAILTGGCTVNLIAAYVAISRGLFPSQKNSE